MFGIGTTELLLVTTLALIFIGPKDLPKAMSALGRWIGQARGAARHFKTGVKDLIRQAELEELERKWREEEARIVGPPASLADQLPSLPHAPQPVP